MAATGIVLDDESIRKWTDMRLHSRFRYVIFMFNDEYTKVQMTKVADADKTLDDLLDEFPPNDVRYAVLQFKYQNDDGDDRHKTIFISWAPDSCSAKKKLVCAGTKSAVKRVLPGISLDIHATSCDNLTYDEIRKRCMFNSH